tara:strand:- start:507 stop:833 length:327 start_codon:yes stop_codon:yes gene_type:complete
MAEFEPFDPKKHKPIDLPGGQRATEYLASEESPEGQAWNIPQVWFNVETGEPNFFKGDQAWNAAKNYEDKTGKKFPRYESISKAVEAAKDRSSSGGATKSSLMNRGGR